jgi:hypothetical protein
MGSRGEGFLRLQDPAAFASAALQGRYAFSFAGNDQLGGRYASAGVFAVSAGNVTDLSADSDDSNSDPTSVSGQSGTIAVAQNGRGTVVVGSSTFAIQVVSATELVAMAIDKVDENHPLASGTIVAQTIAAPDLSALDGLAVVYSTANGPTAQIGLVTSDGAGKAVIVLDRNVAGTYMPMVKIATPYQVAPSGRTSLNVAWRAVTLYLVGRNEGFFVSKDHSVTIGTLEPQAPGPLVWEPGTYFFGSDGASAATTPTEVGTIDVTGSADQLMEDISAGAGLQMSVAAPVNGYSFPTGDPSGRGAINDKTVAYLVSNQRLVFINPPAGRPRLLIVEK